MQSVEAQFGIVLSSGWRAGDAPVRIIHLHPGRIARSPPVVHVATRYFSQGEGKSTNRRAGLVMERRLRRRSVLAAGPAALAGEAARRPAARLPPVRAGRLKSYIARRRAITYGAGSGPLAQPPGPAAALRSRALGSRRGAWCSVSARLPGWRQRRGWSRERQTAGEGPGPLRRPARRLWKRGARRHSAPREDNAGWSAAARAVAGVSIVPGPVREGARCSWRSGERQRSAGRDGEPWPPATPSALTLRPFTVGDATCPGRHRHGRTAGTTGVDVRVQTVWVWRRATACGRGDSGRLLAPADGLRADLVPYWRRRWRSQRARHGLTEAPPRRWRDRFQPGGWTIGTRQLAALLSRSAGQTVTQAQHAGVDIALRPARRSWHRPRASSPSPAPGASGQWWCWSMAPGA
jgi:hypothetical protein